MSDLRNQFITTERPYVEGAVELFSQPIELPDGAAVTHAELTITALGVYEAELDGMKVGDAFLAPGLTYYPHDVRVQTYEISPERLGTGSHELAVYLGQGWYCGRFTFDNKTQIWGERPSVAWELTVELADGRALAFGSRDANVSAQPSGYDYAGLYDGEVLYAAGAPSGPGAEAWPPVPFTGTLPEHFTPDDTKVTIQEEVPVAAVTPCANGTTIIDFGANFAGIVEIDPTLLPANATVTLRHGELLNPDGSLYTANLRKAKATTVYHAAANPAHTRLYRPRFTYMGFRYVELTGAPWVPGLLRAHVVSECLERTGTFTCGNELVNKLYANLVRGQRSNYISVPTDCPQRDERQGYTGDGHVFARTGAYNFDTERFWAKFLQDIREGQRDNAEGYVESTAPVCGPGKVGFLSMLGWGNATCILPELLYEHYGTDRYLHEQYESMRAWVACEMKHGGRSGLWRGPSLGDWLTVGRDVAWMAMHNGPVSNAFVVNDLRIMVRTAKLLGYADDERFYAEALERTRASYIKTYIKRDGRMKDDYQGAYIMALAYVVEPGELWNTLFANLVAHIQRNGMQTGFFATQHLLPLLARHGEARLAYDLLLQEGCPGWMYQVLRGATSIWERWDALLPDGTVNETKMSGDNMVSFNHYAFGSVGEFMYRCVLGIEPDAPGFDRVHVEPHMDARLKSASGSYLSRAGRICMAWTYADADTWTLHVELPVAGTVVLPNGEAHELVAGTYDFCSTDVRS